jgi:2-polyprenyl-6-hydroxyphenyl methylase/3-demethylubiquinone-9 3-methyltransferase
MLTQINPTHKPGGHLFLSTIARTPLSYALTILAAEHILRKVTVGTHTYSKFINPTELVDYFAKYGSPQPWISHASPWPTRTEAEVRGMIYVPWSGEWNLMSRGATEWGAAECNYLFWVRKPFSSDK